MGSQRHTAMTALCRIMLTGSEIAKHWPNRHSRCENRPIHLVERDTHYRWRLARLALSMIVFLIV